MNSHTPSSNDSDPEQAFDALLAEAFDAASPPDLSSVILSRLDEPVSNLEQTIRVSSKASAHGASNRSSNRKRSFGVLAGIAAMAASIAIVAFVRHSKESGPSVDQVAGVDRGSVVTGQDEIDTSVAANDASSPDAGIEPLNLRPRKVAKGTPMVVSNDPKPLFSDDGQTTSHPENVSVPRDNTAEAITKVAAKFGKKWQQYWQAIGVTPSDPAGPDQVAQRFEQALGIKISPEATRNAQLLRESLTTNSMSRLLASRWLDQVTNSGIGKLKQDQRDAMLDEAAVAFRGEQPLNEKLVSWISGSSPQSSAFYKASAASGHDAMVSRLASITMDVDLRCTRCHDALIEGNGRQESYWSFANFLRNGVKRSREGTWSVVSADQLSSKPSFYELPDGRQRLVQPKVDESWVSNRPADTVALWATNLEKSPELARGIVHSVWQMVHGRPLRAHVVDTVTAPHHRLLDELQQQLADDLVRSNFDIARTIALVLTSPPSHRSIPAPLLTENQLMASTDDVRIAMHAVDAFAAAQPTNQRMSLGNRLAIAMKFSGRSLNDLDGSDQLLANIASDEVGSKKRKNTDPANQAIEGFDFPAKAHELPAQWLSSIKSYDSRVAHLGYLANQTQLPRAVTEASAVLRETNRDDQLTLQRVWWLIRP